MSLTQSGIGLRSYGMGIAAGDFNNDGFVDLYRTGLSGAVLLRNNGNGTFTDVTKAAGAGDPGGWGVSATFFDYDRDGWLDLFVGNYLIYSLAGDIQCLSVTGRRDYCPPNSYRAQPSHLYHNRGNGTFEDVTSKAFVNGAYGPALGASTADFNNDGWIDLYVANDGQPNQLWINQHDGTFKDTAFLAGAAVSGTGQAEASMGVDAGDFDNDGDEDLFITNWLDQMNVLYLNDGAGNFEDRRAAAGLGAPSLAKTGFGAGWLDFDRDGWLDLFVANGGVATIEALAQSERSVPAQDDAAAVPQPGHRPLRGRLEPRRRGVQDRGRRPRRGVRRHRQRRRHRHHRRQHQRKTACARERRTEPQPLARAAAVSRSGRQGPTRHALGRTGADRAHQQPTAVAAGAG